MFGYDISIEQNIGKLIGSRITLCIGFIDADFGFAKMNIQLLG